MAAKRTPLRDLAPAPVRLTPEQRACLARAAAKWKMPLGAYLRESALMVAAEEGFTPAAAPVDPARAPRVATAARAAKRRRLSAAPGSSG